MDLDFVQERQTLLKIIRIALELPERGGRWFLEGLNGPVPTTVVSERSPGPFSRICLGMMTPSRWQRWARCDLEGPLPWTMTVSGLGPPRVRSRR
jgi:hypothetical protein